MSYESLLLGNSFHFTASGSGFPVSTERSARVCAGTVLGCRRIETHGDMEGLHARNDSAVICACHDADYRHQVCVSAQASSKTSVVISFPCVFFYLCMKFVSHCVHEREQTRLSLMEASGIANCRACNPKYLLAGLACVAVRLTGWRAAPAPTPMQETERRMLSPQRQNSRRQHFSTLYQRVVKFATDRLPLSAASCNNRPGMDG